MLVVMSAGASPAETSAICQRAIGAGLTATTYEDGGTRMIAIAGLNEHDYADALGTMPGVLHIVQASGDDVPETSNLRIANIRPLVPPAILVEQLPLSDDGRRRVHQARQATAAILGGSDDRLLVVVGPCSIHDPEEALIYARRLLPLAQELADDLLVVMRVYFEKPRTTVGWKGLINDPHLDGSFAVNEGLEIARRLLLDVVELGLPAGCEWLDPITPQFIADAVTWGAIGARTTESQVHRNLTSGMSMPVGFKNGTSGDLQIAIDAMKAAAYPHQFMSVTEQGVAGIVETRGNQDTHVILRGGSGGPNFDAESVDAALAALRKGGLTPVVMIDASHGNSSKDFRRQPVVAASVAEQLAAGQRGIVGMMLESFLVDGRQELTDPQALTPGQSVTDACMGWEMTEPTLRQLAEGVRARRVTASA